MVLPKGLFLLLQVVFWAALAAAAAAEEQDPPCNGGTCPSNDDDTYDENNDNNCGLWLGPSHIKNHEEHGFGLGMFTGKGIKEGTTIESIYGGTEGAEMLLPLYGDGKIYEEHPPLREYVWDEDYMVEVAIEYPKGLTALFIPGLASVVPCTNKNYNLIIQGNGRAEDGRESVYSNREGVHRARDPTAGSFAYRHNVTYVAVRDIAPGEELTIDCTDDDYDGGAYFLSRFNAKDDGVVCLDQNLRVARSSIEGAGRGLFAKRSLESGAKILSSPIVPLHRSETEIEDHGDRVNSKQLMLNYAYGHPDSDLLWLPYGPLFNFANHGSSSNTNIQQQPNAKIQWHEPPPQKQPMGRRQEHHHPELMKESGETVALTHGKSLLMDIVAIRDIDEGEEVLIDYGDTWEKSWQEHKAQWMTITKGVAGFDEEYVDAEEYGGEIRTVREQTVDGFQYPSNLETFCYYAVDSLGVEEGDDDAYQEDFTSWDDDEKHDCFRPCRVLKRHNDEDDVELYTVELLLEHNLRVVDECVIDADTTMTDVPEYGIRVVDRPYSTDVFLPQAFRHEIVVPDGIYPDTWMRKKLRRPKAVSNDQGDEFKRKQNKSVQAATMDS